MICQAYLLAGFSLLLQQAAPLVVNNNTVSIPYEYTYLLPDGFNGNPNETFVNSTTTSNATINKTLQLASHVPFISYADSFLDILGTNPQPKLVPRGEAIGLFAYEAGAWIPERNEVWFSGSPFEVPYMPSVVTVVDLNTSTLYTLNGTSTSLQNVNGGYYLDGKVYLGSYPSNTTYRGGIVSVDVNTLEVSPVLNSYFGLPFLSVDDLAWVTQGNKRYLFFTTTEFAGIPYPNDPPAPALPAGVWRWDPQEKILLPAITRNEVNPNGVRVSPDMRTLYITENVATFQSASYHSHASGPSDEFWLGPYVYAYNLDEDMFPRNRRVFAQVRRGIADGIHVDDDGNVWTGESDGIVVRNPKGKTIGVFNAPYFLKNNSADAIPIANFALAGDTLVIGGVTSVWTIKLGKTVVARNSRVVN